MSWIFKSILTEEEVKTKGPLDLPTQLQLGQEASLILDSSDSSPKDINLHCYVVGIHLDSMNVQYDLAFRIGISDYYSVLKSIPSYLVTTRDGMTDEPLSDDQLKSLILKSEKPKLKVVINEEAK